MGRGGRTPESGVNSNEVLYCTHNITASFAGSSYNYECTCTREKYIAVSSKAWMDACRCCHTVVPVGSLLLSVTVSPE